jgi:hypothetical protein
MTMTGKKREGSDMGLRGGPVGKAEIRQQWKNELDL